MSYTSLSTDELAEELAELRERVADHLAGDEDSELDLDEQERYLALRRLEMQLSDISEWDGLILANDFEEYARELAEDLDMIPSDYSWPASHIDWEEAARHLAMDYTLVTFQGDDYYTRHL